MPILRKPGGEVAVLGRPKDVGGLDPDLLHLMLRQAGFPPAAREYRGLSDKKSRFDLAWPAWRIALELDGGVWMNGRHVRGKGFEEDCRKMNAAAASGWAVFRVTPGMVENEWSDIVRILQAAFDMRQGVV